MPGGVHYLLGLFLIYFFSIFNNNHNNNNQLKKKSNDNHDDDESSSAEETSIINAISHSHQYFKVGLVFGSVVPDIDVLVAVAAIIYSYLMGGTTNDFVEIADLVHRSATHTLLLWVPMVIFTVLLSGAITACINNARSCSSNDQQASRRNRSSSNTSVATDCIRSGRSNSNVSHHHHPRREHDQVSIVKSKRVLQLEKCHCWVQFALGLSIGAIVHVLADTIYLKGVKMMWPWTQKVFFYELPQLHLFHIYYYHPYTQKIFFVIDHCSEIVFYLILIMYTHMDQNTLFKLKCVCYAQFSANFICFLIDRFLDMQFHNFVILLYFPGVPFLAISVSIPLLMAPQIGNFEWSRVFSFSKKTSTNPFSSIGAQKPACKTL